ncbi:MAG: universal stress protein, partial [Halobacteriales archaeon]|nr:universal stress protein [Halobacteriales archaeon]
LNTIEQYDAESVIVGWRGRRPGRGGIVFGSTVDDVVKNAKCDVYVEKIGARAGEPIESILLPTAGGPHAELAAATAQAIARATDAVLQLVYVIPEDPTPADRQRAENLIAEAMADLQPSRVETKIIESDDVVEGIVEESRNHDITIIGATRTGLLKRILFGAIPEAVGQRVGTTVIMTKRYLDVGSRARELVERGPGQ